MHPVIRHFNGLTGQNGALPGRPIKNWVGVVDVDQDFARRGHAVENFNHSTGAALRQVLHLLSGPGALDKQTDIVTRVKLLRRG